MQLKILPQGAQARSAGDPVIRCLCDHQDSLAVTTQPPPKSARGNGSIYFHQALKSENLGEYLQLVNCFLSDHKDFWVGTSTRSTSWTKKQGSIHAVIWYYIGNIEPLWPGICEHFPGCRRHPWLPRFSIGWWFIGYMYSPVACAECSSTGSN